MRVHVARPAGRLLCLGLAGLLAARPAAACVATPAGMLTAPAAVDDPGLGLFPALFRALPERILVLPGEQYYYFRLDAGGRSYRGNLHFPAERRAEGVVRVNIEPLGGGSAPQQLELSAADGLAVRQFGPGLLEIRFAGLSRTVALVRPPPPGPGFTLPARHRTLASSYDESGLSFVLAFDERRRHLYWILADEAPAALVPVGNGFFVSERTGFVFFRAFAQRWPVLIGVSQAEATGNGLCDGPFDQLPDAAIADGELDLSRYIVAEHPGLAGRIDRYGIFLDDRNERFAVAPYRLYRDRAAFLELAGRIAAAGGDEEARVHALTQSRPWLGF